jgi:hypothetical protein
MVGGLVLNILSFVFLGPIPILGSAVQRMMETEASLVLSQLVLGVAAALTQIAAFPFLEGICELTPTAAGQLSLEQRVAISGESKRLVVESPWSRFTGECQRF